MCRASKGKTKGKIKGKKALKGKLKGKTQNRAFLFCAFYHFAAAFVVKTKRITTDLKQIRGYHQWCARRDLNYHCAVKCYKIFLKKLVFSTVFQFGN